MVVGCRDKGSPKSAPFHLEAVSYGRLWDVVAQLGCTGWSLSCLDRISIERTDVWTSSATRQRGNSLYTFCGAVDAGRGLVHTDHVYFGQNYDAGTDVNATLETFTPDGAGGSYGGSLFAIGVNASTGRQTLQTTVVRPSVNAGATYPLLAGQSVSVMGGPGLGQWLRIMAVEAVVVRNSGNATANATSVPTGTYLLHMDTPFTLPLGVPKQCGCHRLQRQHRLREQRVDEWYHYLNARERP